LALLGNFFNRIFLNKKIERVEINYNVSSKFLILRNLVKGGVLMNIKKIAYGLASALVAAPAIALAQLDTSAGGGTNLPTGSITNIITNGMRFLLIMVGILGVIGFVISGIIYLTAAGNEDQIGLGKKALIASITGVIVALLGIVILQAVKGLLAGNNTQI